MRGSTWPRVLGRRPSVLVVGGANLDIKCRTGGDFRPRTSNPGTVTISPGGVANNVARNLARLGVRVALASAIGPDGAGRRLLRDSRAAGVDVSLCRRLSRPTGSYVALLDSNGELVGAVSDMAIIDELGPASMNALLPVLERCDMVMADCNLQDASLRRLQRLADKHHKPLLIDAVSSSKAKRLLPVLGSGLPVFLLSLNLAEAAALSPRLGNDGPGLRRFARKMHGAGVVNLLVHLGAGGVFVSMRQTPPKKPIDRMLKPGRRSGRDVTGAGDSAVAATAFGILNGLDIFAAAMLGQKAAALTIASEATVSGAMAIGRIWKRASR